MPLSFQSRSVGDITVVKCDGRIIEGAESAALRQHMNDLLPNAPWIVLHLGDVHFIDSSGLGLLVRILARTGHGNLKLCAVSAKIADVLKITKLATVFDSYESEDDAIAAFYQRAKRPGTSLPFLPANILCVEKSVDLLTYIGELLRQAGFSVLTVDNLSDALILLKATRPKLVVVSAELRSARGMWTAETFNKLIDALSVIELPVEFGSHDPSETGQQLLDRIRALIGPPDKSTARDRE
jgi:anti-sigma B factor antagonist